MYALTNFVSKMSYYFGSQQWEKLTSYLFHRNMNQLKLATSKIEFFHYLVDSQSLIVNSVIETNIFLYVDLREGIIVVQDFIYTY